MANLAKERFLRKNSEEIRTCEKWVVERKSRFWFPLP